MSLNSTVEISNFNIILVGIEFKISVLLWDIQLCKYEISILCHWNVLRLDRIKEMKKIFINECIFSSKFDDPFQRKATPSNFLRYLVYVPGKTWQSIVFIARSSIIIFL